MQTLVRQICELGWRYRLVAAYAKQSGSAGVGLVQQVRRCHAHRPRGALSSSPPHVLPTARATLVAASAELLWRVAARNQRLLSPRCVSSPSARQRRRFPPPPLV